MNGSSADVRPHSIRAIEYDAETRALVVRFLCGTYQYESVPGSKGAAICLLAGDEQRYAFDSGIEGKYKSTRIGT
jgi:hypothetical protein